MLHKCFKNFLGLVVLNMVGCASLNERRPSSADLLEGSVYCRKVVSEGYFGQPRGEREHCLKFLQNGLVEDNADTFFGNPPRSYPFKTKIHILDGDKQLAGYELRDGKIVNNEGLEFIKRVEVVPEP